MQDNMISVIIPAYNCAQWLPRCLDSLLNQTYSNLEIIVVNDGSKDNTIEVVTAYTDRYEHVKLITKKNGGEYAARVTGVEHALGSWVAFVDADDEVDPDMYERLMRNAQTYNAQISHCGFKMVYSDGKIVYLHNTGELRIQNRETALRDLLEEIIVENGLPGKLFRKELFDGIKEQMDFSIVNNGDMLMNYYLFEKIETAVFEDFCPYHYLQRQGSASRQKLNKHIIYDPIRVRQILVDHCTDEMRNDVRCALARMCLISYRRIAMERRAEYREDREKVRELVAQQLPYVHLLPKRNAVLVKLISRAPWVFDLLYPPFEKLFRK